MEFWFDFASPYAYFAAQAVDAVAARHGRTVVWRPFMLGALFKVTGMAPLSHQPMRGDYAQRDWARLSRLLGVPFTLPADHPMTALAASRAFYWLEEHDPAQARPFARAVFHAYFAEERDMADPEQVAAVAAALGCDRAAVRAGLASPAMKQRLKDETAAALERGIFGSPFFMVDGEPYWGWDRLPMVERQLAGAGVPWGPGAFSPARAPAP